MCHNSFCAMPKLNIRIGKKPSAAVVAVRSRVDEFDAAATGFADATKTSMDTFKAPKAKQKKTAEMNKVKARHAAELAALMDAASDEAEEFDMEGQDDEDHGDFEDDYGEDDDRSHNSEAQRELDNMDMEERLKDNREDAAKRIQALVAKKSSASKPATTKWLSIKGLSNRRRSA